MEENILFWKFLFVIGDAIHLSKELPVQSN